MPIDTETGTKLTYDDYVKIPEDGKRHEIIDGVHVVSPAPRTRHQSLVVRMSYLLYPLQEEGRASVFCSPIDVHLTEFDLVQPDLIAIARKTEHIIGELKIEGTPELVVEILSPSTKRKGRGSKRALYESTGVLEYWIVDPDARTLDQLKLVDGRFTERRLTDGRVESTAFPGFGVELGSIF